MKFRTLLVVVASFTGLGSFAQTEGPAAVRLSVGIKNQGDSIYIESKARTRVGRRFENLNDLPLEYLSENSEVFARSRTKSNGEAIISIHKKNLEPDSTGRCYFEVAVGPDDRFEPTSQEIEFYVGKINLQYTELDSTAIISATVLDEYRNLALEDIELRIYVKRYFRPLWLSDIEFTDDDGQFSITLNEKIPGDRNGNIVVGVLVEDDELYGTMIQEIEIPWGRILPLDTSFDERSMWGTQDKTPLWLLIFPNLIILGVWGTLIFLAYKLYIISKS